MITGAGLWRPVASKYIVIIETKLRRVKAISEPSFCKGNKDIVKTLNSCKTSDIWVEETVDGFDVFDS